MALMQPCSADLPFKVCGFERWVVPKRFRRLRAENVALAGNIVRCVPFAGTHRDVFCNSRSRSSACVTSATHLAMLEFETF